MLSSARGRVVAALLAAAALVVAGSSVAPAALQSPPRPAGGEPALTGRLLVRLDTPTSVRPFGEREERARAALARDRVATLLTRTGAEAREVIPELGFVALEPGKAGQSLAALEDRLARDPLVARVVPEQAAFPRYVPNDPAYSESDGNAPGDDGFQWHLRKERFRRAWDLSRGTGAQVGVVDTGIYDSHPDLKGQVLRRIAQSGEGTGDGDGHGTHVAGLACAAADNGYGIASSGFDCGLIVEKASSIDCQLVILLCQTVFTDSDLADSIRDATNRGAEVINLSLGGGGSLPATRSAINYAFNRDVVIVAAAANEPNPNQSAENAPARYIQPVGTGPDINSGKGLVVTAARYDDNRASFAESSTVVSMAAYGHSQGDISDNHGIFSTWALGVSCGCRRSFHGDNRFAYLSGTSMATPQVVGAAALVRARNPNLSADATIELLKRTARRSGGYTKQLGWGILDAGAAVEAALGNGAAALGNGAAALGKDVTDPSSRVIAPKRSEKRRFKLKIRFDDAQVPGDATAGVSKVKVFVAVGKGGFKLLKKTTRHRIRFRGKFGKRYRFFSRAIDGAGNREAVRKKADAATRILG